VAPADFHLPRRLSGRIEDAPPRIDFLGGDRVERARAVISLVPHRREMVPEQLFLGLDLKSYGFHPFYRDDAEAGSECEKGLQDLALEIIKKGKGPLSIQVFLGNLTLHRESRHTTYFYTDAKICELLGYTRRPGRSSAFKKSIRDKVAEAQRYLMALDYREEYPTWEKGKPAPPLEIKGPLIQKMNDMTRGGKLYGWELSINPRIQERMKRNFVLLPQSILELNAQTDGKAIILAYYVYSQIRAGWKDLQKRGGIFARNLGTICQETGIHIDPRAKTRDIDGIKSQLDRAVQAGLFSDVSIDPSPDPLEAIWRFTPPAKVAEYLKSIPSGASGIHIPPPERNIPLRDVIALAKEKGASHAYIGKAAGVSAEMIRLVSLGKRGTSPDLERKIREACMGFTR
jgi:hypothetical protein